MKKTAPEKLSSKLNIRQFFSTCRSLHEAAEQGDLNNLNKLLKRKKKINVNELNSAKSTPLIYAVLNGHVACAKALLEAGADANIPSTNLDNKTPLHLAVTAENGPLIELLLQYGGRTDMPDRFGKTPPEIARGKSSAVQAYFNSSALEKLSSAI